jgi:ATP-binding cassette, subfamily B, bacterial PglK
MIESLKKVYALLPKGDVKKLILLFIMMVVASFLTLIGIGTIPVFVAVVLDPQMVLDTPFIGPLFDSMDIRTPQRLVVFSSGLLILVFFIKNCFLFLFDYVNNKYMLSRSLILKNRLFDAYMRSPYTYFISRNTSELLRNVNSEVGRILNGTLNPIIQIALHAIMAITIITALIIIEPLITGVGMLLFGGFSILFLRATRSKMDTYGSESLMHRNYTNKAVLQGLSGFKDAKVLNREGHFLDEYNYHADRHRHYDLWTILLNKVPTYAIELIALTGILFIAIVMVLQFRELNSIVTVLALFGAAITKVKPSIINLLAQINTLRYNVYSVEAVYNDLKMLEHKTLPLRNLKENVQPLSLNNRIELRDLEYGYPNTTIPAVTNISITISKNEAVAFVGSSGAGKTTLADVILGLLEPQKGEILADGKSIFDNIQAWQKNIGYIPQFIYLMDDTIRRNICFGIPDDEVDEEKLWSVVETAQLGELVDGLTNGVETIVGERGVRLSGGQRQRIGIARALYNDPQVLIMDEATSALDNVTEQYVVKAINALRGEKTLIMIAHRLTTVQNCDTIYMMKYAEIIASGTYEELLLTSEEFREMSLVDG